VETKGNLNDDGFIIIIADHDLFHEKSIYKPTTQSSREIGT
jgi:hypothetical protein